MKETKLNSAQQLLSARQETLQKLQTTAMRPHGKLWGLDVFSWLEPDMELLANTIHSFPFQVVWISNKEILEGAVAADPQILSNVVNCVVLGTNIFDVNTELVINIGTVAGLNSLTEALNWIRPMQYKKTILLYTEKLENVEREGDQFEELLKILS